MNERLDYPGALQKSRVESAEKESALTIGVEIECVLWNQETGQAVDVDEILPEELLTGHMFEKVGRDAGIASLEFSTRICGDPGEVTQSLLALRRALKQKAPHLILKFQSRAPKSGEALAKKDRYLAFFEALKKESPDNWQLAQEVPKWNSTQFHLGIDPLSPQGISITNILNDIAPYSSQAVIDKFQVVGDEGHLAIWQKYADPRRFSEYGRWIKSEEDLRSFYSGVKRLIKVEKDQNDKDVVRPDLETPSAIGDAISEGTIWWFARPRSNLQTIEWRSFPSLQPSHATALAKDVHALAALLKKELPIDRVISREELSALYAKLSKESYLVPAVPLDNVHWNTMVGRKI